MATTLATFNPDETSMRYQDTFLTQGLNKKLAINTPPGIYQGFRLSTSVAALTVTVSPISGGSDHVAVYQTQTGFSLTIRRVGGSFAIDLSAFASKTVVICLFATYNVGSITSAELRGYEVIPSDTFTAASENTELVVLGTVVVPASGTIALSSITHDRRRPAWANLAPEASPWSPLLKNPGFEHGVSASPSRYAISDWTNRNDLAVNGAFSLGTINLHSGAKSLRFNQLSTSASTGRIEQYQEIPVSSGQLVRVSINIRQIIAPVTGSYTFNIYWGDEDSVATSSTSIVVSTTGVDGAFRLVERTFAVPTAVFVLKTVTFEVINITTATTGVSVVFDDVQVYLETGSALAPKGSQNQHLRAQHVSAVQLEDPSTYALGQLASLLRFDKSSPSSEGRMIIERRDQDYSGSNLPPALEAFGRAFLGSQIISTEARALLARITAPIATAAGIGFTLLWESVPSGLKGLRIYGGDLDNSSVVEPGFLLTVNAKFDGTNWTKDILGVVSAALYISSSSLAIRLLTQSTPDTWTSGAWLVGASLSSSGDFTAEDLNVDNLTVGSQSLTITPFTFIASVSLFTLSESTFTATAHGLLTGDGPVRVANSGGALPTGLVAATDYWIIFVNANTFRLAKSFDYAVTGNFLFITTSGTGTQTLSGPGAFRPSNASVAGRLDTTGGGNVVLNSIIAGRAGGIGGTFTVLIASDEGNARLNITGGATHEYFSGAGPLRLTTTGTLPSGLSIGTDYWSIYERPDILYLAASKSDALVGKAVSIVGSGTGTHTLLSTSVAARNSIVLATKTIHSSASGSPSSTLCLDGDIVLVSPGRIFAERLLYSGNDDYIIPSYMLIDGSGGSTDTNGTITMGVNPAGVTVNLPVFPDGTILSFAVWAEGTGATITANWKKVSVDLVGPSVLVETGSLGPTTAITSLTIHSLSGSVQPSSSNGTSGSRMTLSLVASGTGTKLTILEMTVNRPI